MGQDKGRRFRPFSVKRTVLRSIVHLWGILGLILIFKDLTPWGENIRAFIFQHPTMLPFLQVEAFLLQYAYDVLSRHLKLDLVDILGSLSEFEDE
jgi:hypothetical protein